MDTYDIYELMIIPPNKKAELIVKELMENNPNLNLVSDLIAIGANLDWQDNVGWTALYYCAAWDHLEIAKMLIDAGADVNIQDETGWSALSVCAYWNNPEIARMLIDAGVDLNFRNITGSTALHWSTRRGQIRIVKMLVNAGADKTIPDNEGRFPYDLTENSELQELLKV